MSTPYVAELLLQCQAMHLALAVVPGTNADTLLTIFSTLGQRQCVGKAQLIIDRLVFVQHMPRVMLVTQACEGVIVIGVVVVAIIVTGATFTAGIQGKAAAELLMNMAAIGLQIMTAMDGLDIGFVAGRSTGNDVDHTTDCLVAIQHRTGAANDLNPLDIGQRYAVQVGAGQSGLVQPTAIHQHQGVVHGILTETAQTQGGAVAVTHGIADLYSCLAAQQVQQVGSGATLDLLAINNRYARRCWSLEIGRTGDHGGWQLGRRGLFGLFSGQRQARGQRYSQGNTGQFHSGSSKGRGDFRGGQVSKCDGAGGAIRPAALDGDALRNTSHFARRPASGLLALICSPSHAQAQWFRTDADRNRGQL